MPHYHLTHFKEFTNVLEKWNINEGGIIEKLNNLNNIINKNQIHKNKIFPILVFANESVLIISKNFYPDIYMFDYIEKYIQEEVNKLTTKILKVVNFKG